MQIMLACVVGNGIETLFAPWCQSVRGLYLATLVSGACAICGCNSRGGGVICQNKNRN